MNIYVGNLSYNSTDDDLRRAFEGFGEVASATVVKDKATGRSRGFGFVEMTSDEAAQAAIAALNGTEMDGRTLTVNEARPRTDDRHSSGGRGGQYPPRSGQRSGGGSKSSYDRKRRTGY
jgi:RNA recognition motif-containing protein